MIQLQGKVVLITGASAGIGKALAIELAKQGAHLALVARRKERLDALVAELKKYPGNAMAFAGDVTQDGQLENVAKEVRERFGKIDVVIANAGFGVGGRFEKLKLDDFRRQFETNVFGVLRTVYATLDDLKNSKGSLVLLGSVAGYISLAGNSAYGMSKHAIHGLAQSLSMELKDHGITVTLIAPGFVVSEIRKVDNQGIYRENAKDPAPPPFRMPTDVAARHILRAIVKQKQEAVITKHGKVAVWVQRHAPWAMNLVKKQFAKKRDQLERKEPVI